MLTDAQYALISPTPFIYLTHPVPIVIPDGKNSHAHSNMRITHTNRVRLLREVTGVAQALVQIFFATVSEYTFKTLHKLQNEINANAKYIYSNPGGGSHGHLRLVLTDVQYVLISPTPFIYLTHPVLIVIPDGTNAHAHSNMRIAHTKRVRLLLEVTRVAQDPVQKIVATVKEAYFADIRTRTSNFINNTIAGMLYHLQYKYGQLMPHDLL